MSGRFDLTKSQSGQTKFFSSSEIKKYVTSETFFFCISVYTPCQNVGCKFEWLRSKESTECKINTSIRKGTFTLSQVLFSPLKIDKFYRMLVPLVCLDSLDHIIYVSCIFPRINTMSNENHRKIPRGQLVSIKSLSQ